jgi:sulfate adenylyltransferase subunit 2
MTPFAEIEFARSADERVATVADDRTTSTGSSRRRSTSCAKSPDNARTLPCSSPAAGFAGDEAAAGGKAFRPWAFPFPLLHIDTGHNFDEVIAFRDKRARSFGERLIVRSVEDSIARGRVVLRDAGESRNRHQSVTLLDAIEEFGFGRADWWRAVTKRRRAPRNVCSSFRDAFGQWDPENQRPEL